MKQPNTSPPTHKSQAFSQMAGTIHSCLQNKEVTYEVARHTRDKEQKGNIFHKLKEWYELVS